MTTGRAHVAAFLWVAVIALPGTVKAEDKPPHDLPVPKGWAYPKDANGSKPEGRVVVHVCVDIDGSVTKVTLKQSSGHESLDKAAVALMQRGRYKAATFGGKPALSCKDYAMSFKDPPGDNYDSKMTQQEKP